MVAPSRERGHDARNWRTMQAEKQVSNFIQINSGLGGKDSHGCWISLLARAVSIIALGTGSQSA